MKPTQNPKLIIPIYSDKTPLRKRAIRVAKGKPGPKNVHREQDFETYKAWCLLPTLLRGKQPEQLRTMGIVDPLAAEVLGIKNQREFAEVFGLSPDTLSNWNKRIVVSGEMTDRKRWLQEQTGNVLWALYRGALRHGDAGRVRAWMEIVEDFVPGMGNYGGPAPYTVTEEERRKVERILERNRRGIND